MKLLACGSFKSNSCLSNPLDKLSTPQPMTASVTARQIEIKSIRA